MHSYRFVSLSWLSHAAMLVRPAPAGMSPVLKPVAGPASPPRVCGDEPPRDLSRSPGRASALRLRGMSPGLVLALCQLTPVGCQWFVGNSS